MGMGSGFMVKLIEDKDWRSGSRSNSALGFRNLRVRLRRLGTQKVR